LDKGGPSKNFMREGRDLLTIREFIELAKISDRAFNLLRAQGLGPETVKLNGRLYVSQEEAAAWVLRQKRAA